MVLLGDVDLDEGEGSFLCPRLNYVMSIVEDITDEDSVFISYGVSDNCTPRFIKVRKMDFAAIMFWPSSSRTAY
jgi:hypothetical protein